MIRKEVFVKLVVGPTMDMLKGKASDTTNAAYKYAIQDRKMILTITDICKDKAKVEVIKLNQKTLRKWKSKKIEIRKCIDEKSL